MIKADEEDRDGANLKLLEKLRIKGASPGHVESRKEGAAEGETKKHEKDRDIQAPGPGPENAIAPEGTRDV